MKYPHAGQNDPSSGNPMHHNKANGHEKRHRSDNRILVFLVIPFALDIALKLFL